MTNLATADASVLAGLNGIHLIGVDDIRAILTVLSKREHDYIAAEEISEEAARILRRCSERGWIRHRPNYGKWEVTSRFYLEAPSDPEIRESDCATRASTGKDS